MRTRKFFLAAVLLLTGAAGLPISGANALRTTSDPTAPTTAPASGTADTSTAEKAVAARKERCRLHPGTCQRGQKKPEAPKPSEPG